MTFQEWQEQHSGEEYLVLFWASWCPFCLNKLDALSRADLSTLPYPFVAVASPDYLSERGQAALRTWLEDSPFATLPIAFDPAGKTAQDLGIRVYPAAALFDRKDHLLRLQQGDLGSLEDFLQQKSLPEERHSAPQTSPQMDKSIDERRIYLAGGCFWGVEAYMERLPGVIDAVSGYANGKTSAPTYRDVIQGSGHAETVEVRYDPNRISLELLLQHFFRIIDPTSLNRQGNDRGIQYRSGIYYEDDRDAVIIQSALRDLAQHYTRPIVIEVQALRAFTPAEEEHQDYLRKNPRGYCHIDLNLANEPLADPRRYPTPDDATLKTKLSSQAYAITRQRGTEAPFSHSYWNFFADGIYVDISNGEPLFSSAHKFHSNCGWPSFYRPIGPQAVVYREDLSFNMHRTEVLARNSGAHLGHVFQDGPRQHGGLRYCINGNALRFVPLERMNEEDYGDFLSSVRP